MHSFSAAGDEGAEPWSPLTLAADGALHGATPLSGEQTINGVNYVVGYGNLFRITSKGDFTPLHLFNPASGCEGAWPGGGALLQAADGSFYGTTLAGGEFESGTIYKSAADGSLTTLYSFNGVDGASPWTGLVDGQDGYFYGTTEGTWLSDSGATNDFGNIFRIDSSGHLTVLYTFSGAQDSAHPDSLIHGQDGNFYGTTIGTGSAGDFGSLFRISPQGAFSTIHRFRTASGEYPAGVTQGIDGSFYGTLTPPAPIGVSGSQSACNDSFGPPSRGQVLPFGAGERGPSGPASGNTTSTFGSIFRVKPDGSFTTLHRFSGSDGSDPVSTLTQGRDGAFYGVTAAGGTSNLGTVFRISAKAGFTSLYSFSGGSDGAHPVAAPVQDRYRNIFYGTTFNGGADNIGTIYSLSIAGSH